MIVAGAKRAVIGSVPTPVRQISMLSLCRRDRNTSCRAGVYVQISIRHIFQVCSLSRSSQCSSSSAIAFPGLLSRDCDPDVGIQEKRSERLPEGNVGLYVSIRASVRGSQSEHLRFCTAISEGQRLYRCLNRKVVVQSAYSKRFLEFKKDFIKAPGLRLTLSQCRPGRRVAGVSDVILPSRRSRTRHPTGRVRFRRRDARRGTAVVQRPAR